MIAHIIVKLNKPVFLAGLRGYGPRRGEHVWDIDWQKAYPATATQPGQIGDLEVWLDATRIIIANFDEVFVDNECLRLWKNDQPTFAELNCTDGETAALRDDRRGIEQALWRTFG